MTPEVTWAQRSSKDDAAKNFIWLTILASDVPESSLKLDLQPTSVTFAGYSNSKKSNYAVTLNLFAEIDPAESKIHHSARAVEMKLAKKEFKEEYWPRLLKDSAKVHFLRTDFDKWVDEDEQDGVPDDDYMNQFGGAGGMPGMGGDGGFGGLDFSKLGGAGGMPDLSAMGDMGGMGGEGDDDDDMPDLEDQDDDDDDVDGEAGASSAKTGSKIEEVE